VWKLDFLIDLKPFIITGMSVIAFSNFIFVLFSQTIPSVVLSFFKDIAEIVIIVAVFAFAFTWFLKAHHPNKPKNYILVIYDVFGNESTIDGLRTDFKTHDVAWSFMKLYKKEYPLYNFALVSKSSKSDKKTIFKYI
jgi:hypothetical protein